jgi:hypothetical protein
MPNLFTSPLGPDPALALCAHALQASSRSRCPSSCAHDACPRRQPTRLHQVDRARSIECGCSVLSSTAHGQSSYRYIVSPSSQSVRHTMANAPREGPSFARHTMDRSTDCGSCNYESACIAERISCEAATHLVSTAVLRWRYGKHSRAATCSCRSTCLFCVHYRKHFCPIPLRPHHLAHAIVFLETQPAASPLFTAAG